MSLFRNYEKKYNTSITDVQKMDIQGEDYARVELRDKCIQKCYRQKRNA